MPKSDVPKSDVALNLITVVADVEVKVKVPMAQKVAIARLLPASVKVLPPLVEIKTESRSEPLRVHIIECDKLISITCTAVDIKIQ